MARKGGSRRCAVPGCKRCTLVPPFCKRHRSGESFSVDRSALPGIVGALDPNLGRFLEEAAEDVESYEDEIVVEGRRGNHAMVLRLALAARDVGGREAPSHWTDLREDARAAVARAISAGQSGRDRAAEKVLQGGGFIEVRGSF